MSAWSVRLKDDALVLRVSEEFCVLQVRDGITDDVGLLMKTLYARVDKCLTQRRSALSREHAAAKKALSQDVATLDQMLAHVFREVHP